MSITVVPADKGRFKVLVNFIQRGIEYSNAPLANHEAKKLLDIYPHAMVSYAEEK
jgi:hypothetical protein